MDINMGYCKFENTFLAIEQCLESEDMENVDKLSEREKEFRINLIKKCVEISDNYYMELFGGLIDNKN